MYQDVSFGKRSGAQVESSRLEDVGVELHQENEEAPITDALNLVQSVIQGNPEQAGFLMQSLGENEPVVCHTMTEAQQPDLVQLTIMIPEEALSRSNTSAKKNC